MSAPTVILDVDGTLVDSNDAHARAWADAFAEAGIDVPFDRIRRAIGMGGDKLLPHVAKIGADSLLGERLSARRGEIFTARYLAGVQPFPRVRELLERFADDGFTIVVASSATKSDLRALLAQAGVADLVARQTSSDDAEESKPDPDIVLAALKRVGAAPGAAVMLGDTPYDVEAALRAGIRIVGVESGGWRREELDGAVEVYAHAGALAERYERSIVGRLARGLDRPAARALDGPAEEPRRPAPPWWPAAPLLAIGGAILLRSVLNRRRGRRRAKPGFRLTAAERMVRLAAGAAATDPRGMDEDDPLPTGRFADSGIRHGHASRLRRRDYERLRRVISRIS
jgi:HAD superfamily hydrolase (TIGR01509 family)